MKTLLLIFMLALVSCQKEPAKKPVTTKAVAKTASDSVFVNEADTVHYKLAIIDNYDNSKYMLDNHGKCTVLLTNSYIVGNKQFDNLRLAMQYANTHTFTQLFMVSIKNKKGKFEDIICFNNTISVNENGGYSVYELDMLVNDGMIKYNGKDRKCIKLIFKESDYGDGYRMAIFNFVQDKNDWKLASTETYNNLTDPEFASKDRYYTDTYTDCTEKKGNMIYIGLDCLSNYLTITDWVSDNPCHPRSIR